MHAKPNILAHFFYTEGQGHALPQKRKKGVHGLSRTIQNLGILLEWFFIVRGQGQKSRSKVKANFKGIH